MKYQAVIIDLDGTLLNDNNEFATNNVEAIRDALDEGYAITLASGRPHALMLPFAEQLGITMPLICCNGAYQYDIENERVVNGQPIDNQVLPQLIDNLDSEQFDFTLYSSNGIFATHTSNHYEGLRKQLMKFNVESPISIVPSLNKLKESCGDVYKILVSSSDKQALHQLRASLRSSLQAELSTPNKLDITQLNVNKGQSALDWLSQFDFNPNNTIAFGDGDNDTELFKAVGEPIAMANASPDLRRLANLIVTDNNGCGIGQYLRFIIREGRHSCQHSYSY
ncbi:Cof-type HAD-IIB family hydrolase [Vibrio mediterranei]|uniref:Cof-type HAD-IIB family hydrolase n=1 Tax=Vibrio barjaei TaxID=1676683 RepID=A0ABW7IJP4_9VIBR|nr:Cof-type HAD-IIB family hydrolase [Vibrio mediterranei]EDL53590.1 possible hydrolase, HAD superfamily protein [Vibrio mediterranei AK1]MCG9627227.1 Cof-type HAD-IIB family hydrolase [Vibrio mediterranei]MCG9786494.1 Cof-type HAD-IIB family hydrolase [Vibrio mediterranei]